MRHEVSTKAESCPSCGAVQKKPTSAATGCLAIVLVLFVGSVCVGALTDSDSPARVANESPKPPPKPKTPEELHAEKVERQFSAWDGSHRGLERLIKAAMNDPDSYDHDTTVYWDMKDHLVVRTTYRGKNAFGGVVKNWVKAKVDFDGNVTEVLEQGP